MDAPVIRISLGRRDPDKAAAVEAKLQESRASLESGIRAMCFIHPLISTLSVSGNEGIRRIWRTF